MVTAKAGFAADAFLCSAGVGKTVRTYSPTDVIFAQGDPSDSVMYVQRGAVKLSVLSRRGREAIIALLGAGDFFGESALAGTTLRTEGAMAMTATTVVIIPKPHMIRVLHDQQAVSDRFIAHMLARNIRVEADLVDQLFNSGEKRLARMLLVLAHYGKSESPQRVAPMITQQTLADMIGTTRSRVNFFLSKFKKLGLIDVGDGLKVNASLLTVIFGRERDGAHSTPDGHLATARVARPIARAVHATVEGVRLTG